MFTLEQAIELATQAHAGQWSKPIVIDYTKLEVLIGSSFACDLQAGCFTDNVYRCNSKLITKIDDNNYYYSKPYITHPLAVMEMMGTEEEKIVAVLHDIIEDTEATLYPHDGLFIKYKDLRYELTKEVYTALYSITKWKCDGKPYKQHISDVSKNRLATKVKLADIFHSMSCEPSERAKQKYLKAIPILLKGL